jgi:hypothetical protein
VNTSFVNRGFLLIAILGFVGSCSTAQSSPPPLPPLNLTIKDLPPKFLQFYDEATRENASAERRWELWKKD